MITFNKHVKWRVDKKDILICDCKRLIDLKLPKKSMKTMADFEKGVNKKELSAKEKELFSDFKKLNMLSTLKIRQITNKTLDKALKLLDNEIGTERVRSREFLRRKFKKNKKFFLGLFLDKDLIGVICGFPREDYLLISEIAVDSKFRKRGFGKLLVKEFEKVGKKSNYKKINVGAQDEVLDFYKKLGYKPFLLIQFKEKDYSINQFNKFNVLKKKNSEGYVILEVKISSFSRKKLEKLRRKYSKAYFQYIFVKYFKN